VLAFNPVMLYVATLVALLDESFQLTNEVVHAVVIVLLIVVIRVLLRIFVEFIVNLVLRLMPIELPGHSTAGMVSQLYIVPALPGCAPLAAVPPYVVLLPVCVFVW